MLNELLKTILTALIGAGLKIALAAIGVEVDPVLFNTIVAGIVLWILIHLGLAVAARFAPKYFSVK